MPASTISPITPPQYARRLNVNVEKIHAWISSGELAAIDISANHRVGRPRWRITAEAILAFERSRTSTAPPAKLPRKRAARDVSVTPYF